MAQNLAQTATQKPLPSLAASTFCENMAMMLAAGIDPLEGSGLLCDTGIDSDFHAAATAVHNRLNEQGGALSAAMEDSGYFPQYACRLLAVGEKSGRVEETLRSLADYYANRARTERSLKSAVLYPVVLLLMMAVILVVLLAYVLPVFGSVYSSFVGEVAASSFRYLQAAYVIGGAALAVTLAIGLVLLACAVAAALPQGRKWLAAMAEKAPLVSGVSRQMALSRFARVLASFMASGMNQDEAMDAAAGLVEDSRVRAGVLACQKQMTDGAGLAGAVMEQKLFEPLYARMLITGERSGQLPQVMAHLADMMEEDANQRLDDVIGAVEPMLSGLLTVAVGITLVAAMLPLIGILGAVA